MKIVISFVVVFVSAVLFGASRAELNAYLPALDLLQKQHYADGIAALEKLAPNNSFAATALYLIYSRGYCGMPVDYARSATYFNMLFDDSTRFRSREYDDIWGEMRLPPTDTETTAVIKAYNGEGRIIAEKFPLKGRYPLAQCYEEEMATIGGVGPRALLIIGCDDLRDHSMCVETVKLARAAGSAAAQQWPLDSLRQGYLVKITPEDFQRLRIAADAGHVPSMLLAAAFLQGNSAGASADPGAAGNYLRQAVERCRSYERIGCRHAQGDLALAEAMLKSVPDTTRETRELLEDWSASYNDSKRQAALAREIAGRDDHPDCLYFRSLLLPEKEQAKALAMKKEAAANNSVPAIRELLQTQSRDPDYWFFLMLAGKNNLPSLNGNSKSNYYEESLQALMQARGFGVTPEKHKEALAQLAQVYPGAAEAYQFEFGAAEEVSKQIQWTIRDEASLSASWIDYQGRKTILVKVTPSENENYIDFRLPADSSGSNSFLRVVPSISGVGYNDVWIDMLMPNGAKPELHVNDGFSGPRPTRMRLNIAPTTKSFELRLELQ